MGNTKIADILILILTGFLAYGLQVPWLGFFQDDWNFVFFSSYEGAQGIFEFLILDGRPGASWVYIWGFSLFGYKPEFWQAFSIVLRILTTVVFWQILNQFWQNRRYGNLVISILFLIYPFFTLQPLSIAYAPHFAAFLFYMLSIYLMTKAQQAPSQYLFFTAPAILLTFGHLFTVEYFIGLELLRPIAIWYFIQHTPYEKTALKRAWFLAKHWLPYLFVLLFFVAWRSIMLSSLGVRNDPIASLLGSNSILLHVLKNAPADLILMLINTWFKLFDPQLFVIGPIRNLYIFIISIGAGACYYLALKNFALQSDTNSKKASSLVIGGIIIFVAMTAAYAVGYIIHLKIAPWNSRFSLPALPGLAIVVFTLIEIIITDLKKRHILISILIGLLIGSQNQNTLNFKTVWEKQENLYQQLKWRGPSIKSGTAIIANEEIVSYMGDYPLSFAINTLYEAKPANELPYWFFAISENFNFSIDKVFEEDQLHTERASAVFLGNPEDVVFITYEPENGQCLWVLRPEFSEHKHLPPNLKTAALRSNTNNILEPAANFSVYNQIVDENTNTWCYFYQKAELARQKQDWTRIISLWEEAQSRNLRPYNGFEYLPFIESYANLQKWDEAYNLTSRANKTTKAMYFLLCPTWERLTNETQPSEEKEKYSIDAYQLLKCAVP